MPKRTAIVRPLGLALVLALGIGTVWAALVFWAVSMVDQATRGEYHREQLIVRADGTPLVASYQGRSESLTTLDGEELQLPFGVRPALIMGADLRQPRGPHLWTGLSWWQRLPGFSDYQHTPAYWYFIHDGSRDGGGYFEGYDSGSFLPIGYVGQKGFSTEKPAREDWFPLDGRRLETGTAFANNVYSGGREPGYYGGYVADEGIRPWVIYMISGDRLLELDFQGRSVRTILESPDMLSVGLLQRAEASPSTPVAEPVTDKTPVRSKLELAVRFPDRVLVFHPAGGERRTYQLPGEVRGRGFQFYELAGGRALVASRKKLDGDYGDVLRWIDVNGRVTTEREVALEYYRTIYSRPGAARWIAGAVVPSLLPGAPAAVVASAAVELEDEEDPSVGQIVSTGLAGAWLVLVALVALSACLAWLTYQRQKRYAQPWTGVWTAFVFLFGLPGYAGYRLHRRWPVRLPCPTCNENVPRDRSQCAACGEEFPGPAPKGIEVFA